ncbi:MAG: hypothetical protein WBM44_10615 [Waterburya sp.]
MESEISNQMTATINSAINSCIQVEEARISHRVIRSHQVHFRLNSELIRQIERVKENNHKLVLSSTNLANLRYYALLNAPLEQMGLIYPWSSAKLSFFQRSTFTFATDYLFPNSQQPLTVFRSVIDLEGKISQQIHQDLWQNPQLLPRISQAHYWLILEILSQLPLKHKNQYLWLVLAYSSITVSMISLVIYYYFNLSYLLNLAICISIILILNISLKKIIIKQLKSLIIYHLMDGFLGKSIKVRRIGLQILNFIILI